MEPDEARKRRSRLLVAVGYFCIALAVFQGVISLSVRWSLYWGAPPEYTQNYWLLVAMGEGAAVLFACFGLYAFSGAGCIRRLPFLRTGLLVICALFILRGLMIVPQLEVVAGMCKTPVAMPLRAVISSFVSLAVGILYLAGIASSWRSLEIR
jgi:hypothetical protein